MQIVGMIIALMAFSSGLAVLATRWVAGKMNLSNDRSVPRTRMLLTDASYLKWKLLAILSFLFTAIAVATVFGSANEEVSGDLVLFIPVIILDIVAFHFLVGLMSEARRRMQPGYEFDTTPVKTRRLRSKW